jgi:hypothetical protein
MHIKELQIEQMLTSIIAERDEMLLELNQKFVDATVQMEQKDKEIEELKEEMAKLKKKEN